ncbi:MAG: pyruvate ferredoxin oxidoreductase [Synergistaceae bacterium]|jgi:pyruvate ferredoxin oxidoreductase alpha subunit|nr:pyruvate ferredoxin oxidoreductase [Synergistaceae bacterium]
MSASRQGKNRFLSGNEAAAEGVRLCKPQVIAAYPITPQTTLVEKLSEFLAEKTWPAPCKFLLVESEHSAMAAVMGAAMMGSRVFTASSSQGLLYMCEMLHYVSGSRYPIVMANANRGVATPWSIFGDHRDSFSLRDSGWIQLYVESGQEALDTVVQAYRIAESVLLPVMVNIDGFTLTHTYELVELPTQEAVDAFLPPLNTFNKLSLEAPKCLSFMLWPDYHLESRQRQQKAFEEAAKVIERVDAEFHAQFGRKYDGLVERYRCEDAECVLAVVGSVVGTARVVVDKLREKGRKVGLIKVRSLRPFPVSFFASLKGPCKVLGVVDRDISFGLEGGLYTDVKASLYRPGAEIRTMGFIAGLGGHDVSKADVELMYDKLDNALQGKTEEERQFIGMRWA